MVERDECDGYGIEVGKSNKRTAEFRKINSYNNEVSLSVVLISGSK